MRVFRDLPLRRKLTAVNVLISGVSLALAFVAFALYEQGVFRRQMQRDFAMLAEMYGDTVASARGFEDAASIDKTLATLQADPRIALACVYDAGGSVVARYARPDVGVTPMLSVPPLTEQRFTDERLETYREIVRAGKKLGTLYVGVELDELRARVWRSLATLGVLLAGCSLVALLLAAKLQGAIAEPLVELARVAAKVAAQRDYTVRARKRGEDETGRLIDIFNGMLDQIQARDAALQEARDQLERRVEVRTKEMVKSLSLLSATLESTTDGIFAVDLEGRVVSSNTRFSAIWQVPPDLLAQRERKPITEHAAGLVKDRATFMAVVAERLRTPDLEAHDTIELRDGRCIERYTYPQRIDGRTVGMVMSFRDVTERREAEARLAYERDLLRVLLDSSPDTVYFKDCDSRFVRVSKSDTLRFLGRESALRRGRITAERCREAPVPADANYLIGLTSIEAFGVDRGVPMMNEDQSIMRTGKAVLGRVEKLTVHDGSVRWNLTDCMPWRDRDGNIIGTFAVSKDITALKLAEEKLAQVHRQLLETSRQAGMAEVATGVLHNVGNVLNSVNVSTTILNDQVRQSKTAHVAKVRDMLQQHEHDLGEFLTNDPRGRQLPGFFAVLAEHLDKEQRTLLTELEQLRKNVEHIKDIVAMQQNYAKVSGLTERVSITELVEDAVRMNSGAFARHDVALVRDYRASPEVVVEKHKVLQILVNVMRNAKYACDDSGRPDKQITVRVTSADGRAAIAIIDNGVGIAPENLTRIFGHGFTTRKHGHGFGLHSGALAARELGGALTVQSDGPGRGATFTLEIPLRHEASA